LYYNFTLQVQKSDIQQLGRRLHAEDAISLFSPSTTHLFYLISETVLVAYDCNYGCTFVAVCSMDYRKKKTFTVIIIAHPQ